MASESRIAERMKAVRILSTYVATAKIRMSPAVSNREILVMLADLDRAIGSDLAEFRQEG